MLFPARLRVVMAEGVLFFSFPQEVLYCIDNQPQPGPSGLQREQRPSGTRRRRKAYRRSGSPPSEEESHNEKRKAHKAVVYMSDSGTRSTPVTGRGHAEYSESDLASSGSNTSTIILPHVTPGTADGIIEGPDKGLPVSLRQLRDIADTVCPFPGDGGVYEDYYLRMHKIV
ncbi:hypothetical protein NDU88_007042 [Pleurodeles waltl]|uniref:Uncharacterized protein n=1 Tax=Pleurodeles waltl TaxID=8319 RepID=A0AAV7N5A0_PLEWA|nr:hypothetical protein NDU88_007042 [Pleurodeles waltl]